MAVVISNLSLLFFVKQLQDLLLHILHCINSDTNYRDTAVTFKNQIKKLTYIYYLGPHHQKSHSVQRTLKQNYQHVQPQRRNFPQLAGPSLAACERKLDEMCCTTDTLYISINILFNCYNG